MNIYLVYTPNGDIYERTGEFILCDIQDHLSQGECKVEGWRYEKHMEDGDPPALVLEGNAAINEWISKKDDLPDDITTLISLLKEKEEK